MQIPVFSDDVKRPLWMCPSPKGVATHRLRTTAPKREEPKTGSTGRRKKGQREHSQSEGLSWIPVLTGLSSQFFLDGKGHTFDCQDLGMNKKDRGYWEGYKWGHPNPYHALLLLLLLLSVNIVWSLTCVCHEHLLIQRGLWIWRRNPCRRARVEATDLLSKGNIRNGTGLQQTKHTHGLELAHSEK